MAAELRWILLGLSLVLLAGIWWWGRRHSSQAPGDAQLRETTPSIEPQRLAAAPREAAPDSRAPLEIRASTELRPSPEIRSPPEMRPPESEWGVPPFEPLSIHTQEYERVPVLDGPMMVSADPAPTLAHGVTVPSIECRTDRRDRRPDERGTRRGGHSRPCAHLAPEPDRSGVAPAQTPMPASSRRS